MHKTGTERPLPASVEDSGHFASELREENQRLRRLLYGQGQRVAEMEGQAGKPISALRDRIDLLSEENYLLRREIDKLDNRVAEIVGENLFLQDQYAKAEDRNERLRKLYAATERLHASLEVGQVLRVLVELVVNLIGSKCFDLCAFDPVREQLAVLTSVGTRAAQGDRVRIPATARAALREGRARAASAYGTNRDDVRACIPLKVGDLVVGAILIYTLLAHKKRLRPTDHELFDLIGAHGGAALCLSHIASRCGLTPGQTGWVPMLLDLVQGPRLSPGEVAS